MQKIAIIGAGITGLTAAFELKRRGVECAVFEATDRVGGAIRTIQEEGFLLESGPNSILDTSPKIGKLITALGMQSERLDANAAARKRFIVRNRKPVALPESPLTFFTSPAFSAAAKLRLFREPFIMSKSNPQESLADFVRRRLGDEFLDYAITPFVSGVYAGDPAALSTACAFPKLYALEQKYGSLIKGAILGARERKKRQEVSKKDAPMFTFRSGMEALPRRLAEELGYAIRFQSLKKKFQPLENGGWSVDDEKFSQVIFCIPAHALAELEMPIDFSFFSDIRYPPVASLSLGFRREQLEHPLDGFGMLIPRVEGFYSLGTLFISSIFPGRAPEGMVLLTTFVGGALAPERALHSEDEILKNVLHDLRVTLGLKGEPLYRNLSVHPQAIPQYNVGYEKFLDAMKQIEADLPGLFFAGHYRDGISVADSILSGLNIAERIAP